MWVILQFYDHWSSFLFVICSLHDQKILDQNQFYQYPYFGALTMILNSKLMLTGLTLAGAISSEFYDAKTAPGPEIELSLAPLNPKSIEGVVKITAPRMPEGMKRKGTKIRKNNNMKMHMFCKFQRCFDCIRC